MSRSEKGERPSDLDRARRAIDEIDGRLVELLDARFDRIEEIRRAKGENASPWSPAREAEILDGAAARSTRLDRRELAAVFRTLFSLSRARQGGAPPAVLTVDGEAPPVPLGALLPEAMHREMTGSIEELLLPSPGLTVLPAQVPWEGAGASMLPRLHGAGFHVHACLVEDLRWCLAARDETSAPDGRVAPTGLVALAGSALPPVWTETPPRWESGAAAAARRVAEEGGTALTLLAEAQARNLRVLATLPSPPLPSRRRWLAVSRDEPRIDRSTAWILVFEASPTFALAPFLGELEEAGLALVHVERHRLPALAPHPLLFLDLAGETDEKSRTRLLRRIAKRAPTVTSMGAHVTLRLETPPEG